MKKWTSSYWLVINNWASISTDRIKHKIKRSNKTVDIFSSAKRKREITLIKLEITCQEKL